MKKQLIKIAAVALAAAIIVTCLQYTFIDVLEVVNFNFGQKLVYLLVTIICIAVPTAVVLYVAQDE